MMYIKGAMGLKYDKYLDAFGRKFKEPPKLRGKSQDLPTPNWLRIIDFRYAIDIAVDVSLFFSIVSCIVNIFG